MPRFRLDFHDPLGRDGHGKALTGEFALPEGVTVHDLYNAIRERRVNITNVDDEAKAKADLAATAAQKKAKAEAAKAAAAAPKKEPAGAR